MGLFTRILELPISIFTIILNLDFTLIFTLFIIYSVFQTYFNFYRKRHERFPGPVPLPFIGHLYLFIGNFAATSSRLNEKFGDTYEFSMFGYRTVVLANPKDLNDLFSAKVDSPFLRRIPPFKGIKALGMESDGLLFNNNVPKWKHNRKYFSQSLSPPSFIKLSAIYTNQACEELFGYWSNLKQNEIVKLDEWFRSFTSDMMGLVVSGVKENSMQLTNDKRVKANSKHSLRVNEDAKEKNHEITSGEIYRNLRSEYSDALGFLVFVPTFLWNFPLIKPKVEHYKNVLKELGKFELELINERKITMMKQQPDVNSVNSNNSKVKADFLTMLLTSTDDADVIKQNIREMFGAGIATTTSTLCAIVHHLAKHPEVEKRMVDELFRVLGSNQNVKVEDFDKLKFTEAVINETIRLNPVVPLVHRYSTDTELEIAGRLFPPNTIFGINLAHIQRNPKYFPNPETFDPDRFYTENCAENCAENCTEHRKDQLPKYAFSPFGQGMRSCPGKNFAMAEIKTILANIYRKYTFQLAYPNKPLPWRYTVVNEIGTFEVFVVPRENSGCILPNSAA
ncbi:10802_t:CDS:1 [Ambispora gerdemannii]|uniref:10802_t:CDS:1 n=1 Tax=Ambispora gerdemannii TaxID=144530 RepID=A0A9N8ZBP9_9GLOM|nr:10802_t:CDS:1 [Ambispora gerdemannii]